MNDSKIKPRIVGFTLILFFLSTSLAVAEEASNLDSCGKVARIEGETCANLKVQLDLTDCEPGLTEVQANVHCGKEVVSSYKTKKYNYRLVLDTAETWGKSSFNSKGKIWRAVRKSSSVKPHSIVDLPSVNKKDLAIGHEEAKRDIATAAPLAPVQQNAEPKTNFHFSGVSWVEYESSDGFGYDGTSGKASFTNNEKQGTSQDNMNLNLRLNMDAGIETSRVYSVLDVGDVYYGDTTTGGGQGQQKGDAVGLRNLYLSHKINNEFSFDTGVMPVVADPRAFVFSDDISAFALSYTTSQMSAKAWVGDASRAHPSHSGSDRYWGIQSNFVLNENLNVSPFVIQRTVNGELFTRDLGDGTFDSATGTTRSQYTWLGANANWVLGSVALNATGIYNMARTTFENFSEKDDTTSYLVDIKSTYKPQGTNFTFSLEGLATPGAKSTTDSGNTIIGKRKSFQSPVAASYLLTVATSDGVDEAPGSKKEAVSAGSLASPEGLNLAVLTTQYDFSDSMSSFVRYGYLRSAAESANNSTSIGSEVDFGLTYKLDAKSLIQIDYGYFFAGPYYANPKNAQLTAIRYRLEF